MQNMPLALCGFFALAVQSAFFSPAKIGINKELVGSKHLGFATGIQQMTAMLAMLAGQIVAGWLFDHRYHRPRRRAAKSPGRRRSGRLLVLAVFSVPALVLAWIIPRVPAQGGGKFTAEAGGQPFRQSGGLVAGRAVAPGVVRRGVFLGLRGIHQSVVGETRQSRSPAAARDSARCPRYSWRRPRWAWRRVSASPRSCCASASNSAGCPWRAWR